MLAGSRLLSAATSSAPRLRRLLQQRLSFRNCSSSQFVITAGQVSSSFSDMLLPMPAAKNTLQPRQFAPDERQREAIEHLRGAEFVLADEPTGNTAALTRRIARLIREGNARPDEILALTYTENAAKEMRDRVKAELTGTDIAGLQATTFHAYCNLLLERCGNKFGVLDDKDLWIYLRKRIRELHLKYFVRAANVTQFLDDLLGFIRRCQDELVGPEKYADYVARLERGELPLPRVTS